MKTFYVYPFKAILCVLLFLAMSYPTQARQDNNQPLIVGIKEAPPFVIKDEDGGYSGISIELWEAIAETKNWQFKYQEADIPQLLKGLETAEFDVSVAALTVTSQREETVDFSHPFYTTGLAIATTSKESNWFGMLLRFFSWEF